MHRNALITLLSTYHPTAPEETLAKENTLTFIHQNHNCFERSLEQGHITASCWLLNKEGTQALLTHHRKLDKWVQLGGHCDGNSDILAMSIKEAQEESGIFNIEPISTKIFDVDIHLIPANAKEKAHYHYDISFLLQVKSDEKIQISNESKELRWINPNFSELPSNERSVIRMFNKWLLL
jgi:hypothetical protein